MNIARLHPDLLMPVTGSMRGTACCSCNKPQSSWAVDAPLEEDGPVVFVCALCVLYGTEWGARDKDRVDTTVRTQERAKRVDYAKKDGELVIAEEADHVLGSIVLAMRIERVRTVTRGPK